MRGSGEEIAGIGPGNGRCGQLFHVEQFEKEAKTLGSTMFSTVQGMDFDVKSTVATVLFTVFFFTVTVRRWEEEVYDPI